MPETTTHPSLPTPPVPTAEQALEALYQGEIVRVGHHSSINQCDINCVHDGINVYGSNGRGYGLIRKLYWEDPALYEQLQAVIDHAATVPPMLGPRPASNMTDADASQMRGDRDTRRMLKRLHRK